MKHRVTEKHQHPKFPRLVIDLRSKSQFYQARTFLDGQLRQHSTKTPHLTTAFKLAGEWYQSLHRGQRHIARAEFDSSMSELFASYKRTLQTADRKAYAAQKWSPIQSFWGHLLVTEILPTTFRDFYAWRRRNDKVSNSTLHKDTVLIRQVIKHAAEHSLISALPLIPSPGQIPSAPRKWLNKAEWQHLLRVSDRRIAEAKKNKKLARQRQDCHDFAVFMVHSMMRVDEVRALKFSDCALDENAEGEHILICDVKGKTGHRPSVCMPGAASVYKRRYRDDLSNERIFTQQTRDAFRSLLEAADLRTDSEGRTRNLKSLRSTAISFRVLDGSADLFDIARNAGTSVQMIDQFYAKPLTSLMKKDALTRVRPTDAKRPRQKPAARKRSRSRR